eukprot:TRINITY_DN1378_c0_g1_i3.p1 TRINITY_DN1378_c0_g1~~TRINITY_DN1378_c0_g1_i3.p1  ORF type:complete len:216 (-),score=64.51 TRINITY_DN1378_c0_g1_i3:7-654(-)
MTCTDGAILAVEKIIKSKLLEVNSQRKLFHLAKHAGMAVAGLHADGRSIVQFGREEAANWKKQYGVEIKGKVLADRIGDEYNAVCSYNGMRPYGCSTLLAAWTEKDGASLFRLLPDASVQSEPFFALGKAENEANTMMDVLKKTKMTVQEGIDFLAKVIVHCHDDVKDPNYILEMSIVGKETDGKHIYVDAERQEAAVKKANAELNSDSESEDED